VRSEFRLLEKISKEIKQRLAKEVTRINVIDLWVRQALAFRPRSTQDATFTRRLSPE
jgi:hypothetical protein